MLPLLRLKLVFIYIVYLFAILFYIALFLIEVPFRAIVYIFNGKFVIKSFYSSRVGDTIFEYIGDKLNACSQDIKYRTLFPQEENDIEDACAQVEAEQKEENK